MSFLSQVGVVLAKVETTPGVDATPSLTLLILFLLWTANIAPSSMSLNRNICTSIYF
jgi:hypothetical protein